MPLLQRVVVVVLIGCAGPEKDAAEDRPPDADSDSDTDVEPSSDASLAALDVGATLTPAFDPGIGWYAVRVGDLADPFAVAATPTHPAATVTMGLETVDGAPVADGTSLAALPDHRVLVEVTSSDGTASRRYAVGILPDDFPGITATGTGSPGWYLLATLTPPFTAGANHLMALDEHGTPAWWRRTPRGQAFDLRVGRDGSLIYAGPEPLDGNDYAAVTFDRDYGTTFVRAVDELPYELVGTDPHEHDRLADGGAIVMGNVLRSEDLSAYGKPNPTLVKHQVMQILDPAGAVTFSWDTLDKVDYAELPAAILEETREPWEALHFNSAEIDPYDGHLLLSLRVTSEVVKVALFDDVIAGRDVDRGEIAWRLGGLHSDFAFVGDERIGRSGFAGQHTARTTGPGTVAVFDNALDFDLGDTGAARFVEYALDTTAWTATRIASYDSPAGVSAAACGSVQRLPDGGTLVGWGTLEGGTDLTELDASGEILMEVELEEGMSSYRVWKGQGDPLEGTWTAPDLP